jgi:hypothetical protein
MIFLLLLAPPFPLEFSICELRATLPFVIVEPGSGAGMPCLHSTSVFDTIMADGPFFLDVPWASGWDRVACFSKKEKRRKNIDFEHRKETAFAIPHKL